MTCGLAGHGRSQQPWHGNATNTYADDLGALIEALDLEDAVLVGDATGTRSSTRTSAPRSTAPTDPARGQAVILPLDCRLAHTIPH